MFNFLSKTKNPFLVVKVNDNELCSIFESALPCEKMFILKPEVWRVIEFIDFKGITHTHDLQRHSGWFHFSICVSDNLVCQAECLITQSEKFDEIELLKGQATKIRFQPFFIPSSKLKNRRIAGKGLFRRGLLFSGHLPGPLLLSCECDYCHKSFLVEFFHTGFSYLGYFYSSSGAYTITVPEYVRGCPGALTKPDRNELAELEHKLPKAPDGSDFKYSNPFRCPHCKRPYIDFQSHPKERRIEYYGIYFDKAHLLKFESE
jgi:hypothetical protein